MEWIVLEILYWKHHMQELEQNSFTKKLAKRFHKTGIRELSDIK